MSIHCDIRSADFGLFLTEHDSEGNVIPETEVEYPPQNEQDVRRFYEIFGDDVYKYDDHLIGVKPLKEVDEDGDVLVLLGVDGEIEKVKLDTFVESLRFFDVHAEFGSRRPYGKKNVLSAFSLVLGTDRNMWSNGLKKATMLMGIMATFVYFLTELEPTHKGAQLYKKSDSVVNFLNRSYIDGTLNNHRQLLLEALNESTHLSKEDVNALNKSELHYIEGPNVTLYEVPVPSNKITAKLEKVRYRINTTQKEAGGVPYSKSEAFLVTKPLISEILERINDYTGPEMLALVNSVGRDVWYKYELGLIKLGIQHEILFIEALENVGFSDETIVNTSRVTATSRIYLALAGRLLGAYVTARLLTETPSYVLRLKSISRGELDKDSVLERLENHVLYGEGLKKKGKIDASLVEQLLKDLKKIIGKNGERTIRHSGLVNQTSAELLRVYDLARKLGVDANWDEAYPPTAMRNMS